MSATSFNCTILVKTDNVRIREKIFVVVYAINDSVQLLGGDKIEITTNEKKIITLKGDSSHIHFFKPGLMGMISPRTRITEGYGYKVTAEEGSNTFDFFYDNGKISPILSKGAVGAKATEVSYKLGDMFLKSALNTAKELNSKISGGGSAPNEVETTNEADREFESSLEGQDLTFALAWKTLGDDKACKIFESIGQIFGCIDGQKDFRKCLLYLTDGKTKEGAGPRRMCFAGRKKDGSPNYGKGEIADNADLEDKAYCVGKDGHPSLDQLIFTPDKADWDMFVQLRLHDSDKGNDSPCTASWSGFVNHFFSVQGMGTFYSRFLESIECSDQAMVQLMSREFKSIMKNFYLIHEPMQVLSDRASNDSKEPGIVRLIKLKIKLDLDKFAQHEHPYTRMVLSWVNKFSVEILKEYEVGNKAHNLYDRMRACAFGWDRETRSIFFDAIKRKDDLLWCQRDSKGEYNMTSVVMDYNSLCEKINKEKIEKNIVKFEVGSVFFVRLNFELCLAEVAGLSMGSGGTSLYFRCEITTDRRMEATLVDITGAKAKAAALLMSNTVKEMLASVKAIIELTAPSVDPSPTPSPRSAVLLEKSASLSALEVDEVDLEDSEDVAAISTFNRLSFIIMGKVSPSSVMGWLVKTLWEKTVESNFVFEFAMLWGRYWRCLAEDVREVAQTSASFFGKENTLQKKISTGILDPRKRIEGESAKFANIIKSVKEKIHDISSVHGRLSPDQIVFDVASDKWNVSSIDPTRVGSTFKKIEVSLFTPPEAISTSVETIEDPNTNGTTTRNIIAVDCIAAETSFDIWSLGAVLYQMVHPKHHMFLQTCPHCIGLCTNVGEHVTKKTLQVKVPAIKVGSILASLTDDDRARRISDLPNTTPTEKAARNLLSCMLLKDAKMRITTDRIMQHPFITSRPFTRLAGDDAAYDVFLSYRVDSDSATAKLIYDALTSRNYKVWWDKMCIPTGRDWKEEFCQGLIGSANFVPIISRDAVNFKAGDAEYKFKNFSKLESNSPCDNVLLEWRLALELRHRGMISGISAVLIGVENFENTGVFKSFFDSRSGPWPLPDFAVDSIENNLNSYLSNSGLGDAFEPRQTVQQTYNGILANQAVVMQGPMTTSSHMEICIEAIVKMIEDSKNKKK